MFGVTMEIREQLLDGGRIDPISYEDLKLIKKLVGLINTARGEGILALEAVVSDKDFNSDFLRFGARLIIDGLDPKIVETILVNMVLSDNCYTSELRRRMVAIAGLLCMQAGVNPRVAEAMLLSWYGDSPMRDELYIKRAIPQDDHK